MTSSNLLVNEDQKIAAFGSSSGRPCDPDLYALTLCRAAVDSMTTALIGVDGHAQTNGSLLSDKPIQVTKLSSKRAPKKLAISLIPF
ncbi:hypothetical protein ACS77_22895 [Pseudomonas syringae]|uniref:Uncharacterized protein n=1 Tax=Pseudomonas syringae TaxID=317 RepID=A0A0L1M0U8_PSESX|nr:hypothetical protein ACS77_22895 [Pseudomonas syringae]